MYQILLNNCNSIQSGNIGIKKNKLNIKYGMNGTGKSTIAKAIKYSSSKEKLQELRSFFSNEPASIEISHDVGEVLVFDEDFVNSIVFQESDIIQNSFEVFLKTPSYDAQKVKLDERLESLHDTFMSDDDIIEMRKLISSIIEKFPLTTAGSLKKTGTYKSILSKNNLYNIPEELFGYQSFIKNTDINISWIDWKNKGDDFDIGDDCPYCTERINRPVHNVRKQVFRDTYKKADSKNLKDILDLVSSLEEYLKKEQFEKLIAYIKTDVPEADINHIITSLVSEISLLLGKFELMESFGRKKIAYADIGSLEQQVRGMLVPDILNIFGGQKTNIIVEKINSRVNTLLAEIGLLKADMGRLKAIMKATINTSQTDINEFLRTAGINYELYIDVDELDETKSKAILRQCYTDEKTRITEVKKHLSWGEKNAFSLVLFMYYANMKNPDLIILDDPISSFDSNKKYAIMHRLFKNIGKRDVSFENKTVLLLTHDFEPIIDFLLVGKLDDTRAVASYIWNENRHIQELDIDINRDLKLITESYASYASNASVNIVSRVSFLRKLCELNSRSGSWGYAYEILSCLIHAAPIQKKIANNVFVSMSEDDVNHGMRKIKEFIPDFDYEYLKNNCYSLELMKRLYLGESNSYFKMQIFRAMKEIADSKNIRITEMDSAWYKFVDETYHIENDYLHFLDLNKFNIVPYYIQHYVDKIVESLKIDFIFPS